MNRRTNEKPDHPTWDDLISHAQDPTADRSIDAHISHCSPCREQLDEALRLLAIFRDAREARFSAPDRAEAKRILAEELKRQARIGAVSVGERLRETAATLKEVWADLVLDSLSPSHALRGGAGTAAPRMLLYETGDHTITLSLPAGSPPGAPQALHGQVAPRGDAPLPFNAQAFFEDAATGGRAEGVTLSPEGSFSLPAIPEGQASLTLILADEKIHLRLPQEENPS